MLRSHQFEAVEDNGGGAYLDDHWNAESPSLQEQSEMRLRRLKPRGKKTRQI